MSERNTTIVHEGEELSMDLMKEKFYEGAIWYGSNELNIGWPAEFQISGTNLIRLLHTLRNDSAYAMQDVQAALDQHHVPAPEGLSQADRIHLLVGKGKR
jgi:hypothetical protein